MRDANQSSTTTESKTDPNESAKAQQDVATNEMKKQVELQPVEDKTGNERSEDSDAKSVDQQTQTSDEKGAESKETNNPDSASTKNNGKDSDDSFGAGSQITLEL